MAASYQAARDPRQRGGDGIHNGFTLVEMMVALFLFGILASGAVLLLRFSVDAENTSRLKLNDLAELRRFSAIWNADLAQAVPRTQRDADGDPAAAFVVGEATENGSLLRLVRGGWTNYEESARPSLQKLEYALIEDRLERISYPMLDGSVAGDRSVVLTGVDGVEMRFRQSDGQWTDIWAPQLANELPIAVELTVEREGREPLKLLALTGANYQ